ncbi:alkaline phosphatase PhoX [Bacillus sp. REN10]|uniref:alkaline phosphatase PhoX n=1 Tax=Bacillus sp. REN10 TaxID=2782541 RepID=UPI00193B35D4
MKKNKVLVPLLSLAVLFPVASNVLAKPSKFVEIDQVGFVEMAAPQSEELRNKMYSDAKVEVTYSNGMKKVFPLEYKTLFQPGDVINEKVAGVTYDINGQPILDPKTNKPFISKAPDSNTLLSVNGSSSKLYLINHYESVPSTVGNLPKAMVLNTVKQDKKTGELTVTDMQAIDFSEDGGIWTPCAGSLSPWNTHLGSEEYEPDAKSHELNPENSSVTQFARNYYKDTTVIGNPYLYGHLPEVIVHPNGETTAIKHYSMGRLSYERVTVMEDNRTVYYGDDGSYTSMFMYVADKAKDLSAGTLYAAKWKQASKENGGQANIEWIKLGHATDEEIKDLAMKVKFSDIFETTTDEAYAQANGFQKVKAAGRTEWLKVKPGMEKAAAFLESRRYAALQGATHEFNKMEAVEVNKADDKLYMAMSGVKGGMEQNSNDPVDDIQLDKLNAGAIYEMPLKAGVKDSTNKKINSDFVATSMGGIVLGEDLPSKDKDGNTANPDKMANPDNIVYSEAMRTIFIAEDSGMHTNNFTWAYSIDTGKLSRIASVPKGGEATGLQVLDNMNGHSYLMLSSQNPGNVGYLDLPVIEDGKNK